MKRSPIATARTWGSPGSSDTSMTPTDVSPGGPRAQTLPAVTDGGSAAFIRMLLAEAGRFQLQLIGCTALAGLATATLIVIVNSVADRRNIASIDYPLLVTFTVCCAVVLAAQARALHLTTRASEATVERLRVRLVDLVRRADLDAFEALGPARLYAKIASDTATLSEAGALVIAGAVSAVALMFAALYIATLSRLA